MRRDSGTARSTHRGPFERCAQRRLQYVSAKSGKTVLGLFSSHRRPRRSSIDCIRTTDQLPFARFAVWALPVPVIVRSTARTSLHDSAPFHANLNPSTVDWCCRGSVRAVSVVSRHRRLAASGRFASSFLIFLDDVRRPIHTVIWVRCNALMALSSGIEKERPRLSSHGSGPSAPGSHHLSDGEIYWSPTGLVLSRYVRQETRKCLLEFTIWVSRATHKLYFATHNIRRAVRAASAN